MHEKPDTASFLEMACAFNRYVALSYHPELKFRLRVLPWFALRHGLPRALGVYEGLPVMSENTRIATAGNVLPGALACLQALGYVVTVVRGSRLSQAVGSDCTLVAEDPLLLLGLAKLHELRGSNWRPTDADVEAFLQLESQSADGAAP